MARVFFDHGNTERWPEIRQQYVHVYMHTHSLKQIHNQSLSNFSSLLPQSFAVFIKIWNNWAA